MSKQPNWESIIESINKSRIEPDLNVDYFFSAEDRMGKYHYHMNIDMDLFLTFWTELLGKDAICASITPEEFTRGSIDRIVTCRAIESINEPNKTGYLELYKVDPSNGADN